MAEFRNVAVQDPTGECQHHWVIDTPNGSYSGGRCKRCGAERSFRNSNEDMMWDSDSFSLNGSRYRARRTETAN